LQNFTGFYLALGSASDVQRAEFARLHGKSSLHWIRCYNILRSMESTEQSIPPFQHGINQTLIFLSLLSPGLCCTATILVVQHVLSCRRHLVLRSPTLGPFLPELLCPVVPPLGPSGTAPALPNTDLDPGVTVVASLTLVRPHATRPTPPRARAQVMCCCA
jgi:hypothetical protein